MPDALAEEVRSYLAATVARLAGADAEPTARERLAVLNRSLREVAQPVGWERMRGLPAMGLAEYLGYEAGGSIEDMDDKLLAGLPDAVLVEHCCMLMGMMMQLRTHFAEVEIQLLESKPQWRELGVPVAQEHAPPPFEASAGTSEGDAAHLEPEPMIGAEVHGAADTDTLARVPSTTREGFVLSSDSDSDEEEFESRRDVAAKQYRCALGWHEEAHTFGKPSIQYEKLAR